jgi:hypothetical protein
MRQKQMPVAVRAAMVANIVKAHIRKFPAEHPDEVDA